MNYSLSNFKIFSGSEPHSFELAPITMLIGENNSGKSTITKSLLLFQDFFDKIRKDFIGGYFKSWDDYVLDFTVGDHKLGSFENVLPFGIESVDFKVGFSIKSNILCFMTNNQPTYDVEMTFGRAVDKARLCLQAYIKEVQIKIGDVIFYSYKDKKELINLTPIKEQYLAAFNTITKDASRVNRISGSSFRGWFIKNPKIAQWKYQRLLNILLWGGRMITNKDNEDDQTLTDVLSIFPINSLKKMGKLNAEDFESYITTTVFNNINELRLDASMNSTSKAHLKRIIQDFKKSDFPFFGEYLKNLEEKFSENIQNLVIVSQDEDNFITHPWSDISNKKVNDISRDINDSLKFEYVLTLLCLSGEDDYLKHHYVLGLRNYILLLLGEVFIENDKLVNFVHLGLDRASMQRLYTFKSQGNGFNRLLANYMQLQSEVKNNYNTSIRKGAFIKEWIQKMTKYDDIAFEYAAEGEGVFIYLKEKKKENKQTLADVGYGMTPLIAILIQIELAILQNYTPRMEAIDKYTLQIPRNEINTIIIEEPESNLHPNYQAKLADLFVDAYKEYGIEFILETHSEYLARRMQVIVKEKGIDKENIIIHNLKDGQNREIRIKEDGNLSQRFWPGFYSEATSLIGDLI